MRVFVTGASGFVGSAIVQELLQNGHSVLGLARSEDAAKAIAAAGADVHEGSLEDADSLQRAVAATDGVIHTAFIHDFSRHAAAGEVDRQAITVMGEALAGSGRPLIVTSGTAAVAAGKTGTELDAGKTEGAGSVRSFSEVLTRTFTEKGVRAMLMRLPPSVHGAGDHGFVPWLINIAREKGVAAYVEDGRNVWPAVHRPDAARLYRLALEKGLAGTTYHAVGEEGVPTREIAEVIGRRLNLPVVSKAAGEAADHFGFLGHFFSLDVPSSGKLTREWLGWNPSGPGLIADLDSDAYFA
jgi:nucleoside-diphosphate-sugar epimerase